MLLFFCFLVFQKTKKPTIGLGFLTKKNDHRFSKHQKTDHRFCRNMAKNQKNVQKWTFPTRPSPGWTPNVTNRLIYARVAQKHHSVDPWQPREGDDSGFGFFENSPYKSLSPKGVLVTVFGVKKQKNGQIFKKPATKKKILECWFTGTRNQYSSKNKPVTSFFFHWFTLKLQWIHWIFSDLRHGFSVIFPGKIPLSANLPGGRQTSRSQTC